MGGYYEKIGKNDEPEQNESGKKEWVPSLFTKRLAALCTHDSSHALYTGI